MFATYMQHAWLIGTLVAALAGAVGFFVVARGDAFVAHALPNAAFTGAAAANLFVIDPLWGLGVATVLGALGLSSRGVHGRRDAVTALWLVGFLAAGSALLGQTSSYGPAVFALLFGEVLGASSAQLIPVLAVTVLAGASLTALARPLLFGAILPSVAEARGLALRRLNLLFLLVVAAVTAVAVPVVGALLMFTLLLGPAAAARSLCQRPWRALAASVFLALAALWLALAAAWATNWPVGFFVGTFAAAAYGLARLWAKGERW
jgi:zinc/manganese transport system permease protein